ncbi:hypothetical protein RB195_016848 [Necator americanus]|uniref:Receptor L-domain domain-containing protein n=1 Tax=Necator americanus TaxID=51031 RepID=A0ABR1C5L9_NECAM
MSSKSLQYLSLTMFCFMPYINLCEANTFNCIIPGEGTKHVKYTGYNSKMSIRNLCDGAEEVSITGESIFVADGLPYDFIEWLFHVNEIKMCVSVVNTDLTSIDVFNRLITGDCEGPKLSVVNNSNLQFFTIGRELVRNWKPIPNALRVRANRKLRIGELKNLQKSNMLVRNDWDLQEYGECSLPIPFDSFHTLDPNCTSYYGVLVVKEDITQIPYKPSNFHSFKFTGCIRIEKTSLKDVTFLLAFSKFKPIPLCQQYIRNNMNLCPNNLNYLNVMFSGIEIANNSERVCDECMGGDVTEHYLEVSANCSLIYGDLTISNWKGLPSNVHILRKFRTIEGRLIISNNTGLNDFEYLTSLENVGLEYEGKVAIIIKNNPDLKTLPLPNLVGIKIGDNNPRVMLENNPLLDTSVVAPRTTTTTKKTSTVSVAGTTTTFQKSAVNSSVVTLSKVVLLSSTMTSKKGVDKISGGEDPTHVVESSKGGSGVMWYIITGAIIFLFLLLLGFIGTLMYIRIKRTRTGLPPAPYQLNKRSQDLLISICKEIVGKNPMVWCIQDVDIIWRQTRSAAGANTPALSKKAEYVKKHMIAVTNNGRLPQKREVDYDKPLHIRVQELFQYDLVIMIGTDSDVTKVVSRLPSSVGDLCLYIDGKANTSLAYKLLESTHLSPKSTLFKYEAKDVKKRIAKTIDLVLYHWPSERLPKDFSELLRLMTLCNGRKVVCTSIRRKEVFSLLYLVHGIILSAKESLTTIEVFRLHSELCNGAPLDRHEMLYVMRLMLDWARCAKCLPENLKKDHSRWCQIYDQMSAFSRRRANIINIHPVQLVRLDEPGLVEVQVEEAVKQVNSFSERPYAPVSDAFRRKSNDEIKREMNRLPFGEMTRSVYEPVEQVTGNNEDFWTQRGTQTMDQSKTTEKSDDKVTKSQISNLRSLRRRCNVGPQPKVSADFHPVFQRKPETWHVDCQRILKNDEEYINKISRSRPKLRKCSYDMSCESIRARVLPPKQVDRLRFGVAYARIVYENYDLVIKSVKETVEIYEMLNGVNDVAIRYCSDIRCSQVADQHRWDAKSLHIFKNESAATRSQLNAKFNFAKGSAQASLSRAAVEWMVNTVNLTRLLYQLNRKETYGVDELLIPSLQVSDDLDMPGRFTSKCLQNAIFIPGITRFSFWYNTKCGCPSGTSRNGICILGIEDLEVLSKSYNLIANKVLPTFDYAVVDCIHEIIFNKTHGGVKHVLDLQHYRELVHVEFHKQRLRSYSDDKVICVSNSTRARISALNKKRRCPTQA